jgi:hypothetical protein
LSKIERNTELQRKIQQQADQMAKKRWKSMMLNFNIEP